MLAGCAGQHEGSVAADPPAATVAALAQSAPAGTVRLLFVGDLMLGRRVGPIAAAEGPDLLRDIRHVVSSADLAAANLESPLTNRPHLADTPNALEAAPAAATLLAGAGFDLVSVANNHATDAGAEGLADTLVSLGAAGVEPLGAGATMAEAGRTVLRDVAGLRIAFLAFDATGVGVPATENTAGVSAYSAATAQAATTAAASSADLIVVSLHGGVEYLLDADPTLDDIADDLVAWGTDVVWGHGAHVPQPVLTVEAKDGGSAVVATSLGNFLFDQQRPATQTGLVLEVMAQATGVVAYRVGRTDHHDLRPRFVGWDLPSGDAVLLDQEWWSLVSSPPPAEPAATAVTAFAMGDVTTAGSGDATGDGKLDVVISYRHAFRPNPVNQLSPDRKWVDAAGRSAHLGVFAEQDLAPVWAAGTLQRPVARLSVCDGSLALAFDSLDDRTIVATAGWTWWSFGFAVAPELPGPGTPVCADVDQDGRLDPVILDR
jgi:poly-gamma-glutamate capsule biosynthesis protein CapA/YwtB (metallophosphatase superfamily)